MGDITIFLIIINEWRKHHLNVRYWLPSPMQKFRSLFTLADTIISNEHNFNPLHFYFKRFKNIETV